MRQSLILAGALVFAVPALADDVTPAAGRYAVQPSDDGFVRLDTETGMASHCSRTDDVWRCQPIAAEKTALEDQVQSLSRAVDALTAEVRQLKSELIDLRSHAAERQQTTLLPEDEKEFDRAMGFAERLMKRFFDMVRELKGEERPSI